MSSPETTHQQLMTAACRVITDATHYRLDDERLAVSPESIAALKTALAAYEALLRLASVQIIISDGATILLDACLRLPLAQAHRLARRFIAACQGQTASKKNGVIHFNRAGGPYGFLSNFARYPIRLSGYIWPTVEHYYQAQKFAGTEDEHLIRLAASPALAAQLGRDRTRPRRPDWPEVRGEVIRQALLAKFSQHRRLREQLLATGSATLVERTHRDAYSGDDGRNRLGRLLMQLRDQLRQEALPHGKPPKP